jgi:hypothetical protein
MSDNNFPRCARRAGVFRRVNLRSGKPEFKAIGFPCGKKHCPYCQRRRRARLLNRLQAADFSKTVVLWTITTDPKILNPEEALLSLNKRWHIVHRSLLRSVKDLRYFRVIEFTESGLPHMHLITDSFIDWNEFQRHLTRNNFGCVLHFKTLPREAAIKYVTKYITKAIYSSHTPYDYHGRFWAASLRFLPIIVYSDSEGTWELLWIDKSGSPVLNMLEAYRIHESDTSPPRN